MTGVAALCVAGALVGIALLVDRRRRRLVVRNLAADPRPPAAGHRARCGRGNVWAGTRLRRSHRLVAPARRAPVQGLGGRRAFKRGYDGGPPPKRPRTVTALFRNLMVVAVVAAVAVLVSGFLRGDPGITGLLPGAGVPARTPGQDGFQGRAHKRPPDRPTPRPPGLEEAGQPLGFPAGACGNQQIRTSSWPPTPTAPPLGTRRADRCTTSSTRFAPDGSGGLLANAIAKIAAATGIQFVDDGTSEENPPRSASRTNLRNTRTGGHRC